MLPSLETTRENWRNLVQRLPGEAELGREVSTGGPFVMSVLEEAGWRKRAHWVPTPGIDRLRKPKYDRRDARRLARKRSGAHRDPLPEAWFPPAGIRELRLRARQRCQLTLGMVPVRSRARRLLQRYGVQRAGNPLSAAGGEELVRQKLPAAAQDSLQSRGRI